MKLYTKSCTHLFSRNLCYNPTRVITRLKYQHLSERSTLEVKFRKRIPNPTIKIQHVCSYCDGSGIIPCNACDLCEKKHCSICSDKWYITCQICGGTGVSHSIYN